MQQVKAVVALALGEPVQLTTINVPDPGPGEAVVQVQACGVCHTDLHYREGGINDEFPFLLGHEAAGVVEAVGPDVTGLEPGDFVVLNWRAVCGSCRACDRGEPWYCFATHNATQKMTLAEGDLAGTVVLVGVPTPDMKVPDIPLIDVFGRGGSLKSSWYGDCLPSRDFPMLVDLYRQGRLDLDAFVTEEIALDDVEAAFDKMHSGDVLRSVVIL